MKRRASEKARPARKPKPDGIHDPWAVCRRLGLELEEHWKKRTGRRESNHPGIISMFSREARRPARAYFELAVVRGECIEIRCKELGVERWTPIAERHEMLCVVDGYMPVMVIVVPAKE